MDPLIALELPSRGTSPRGSLFPISAQPANITRFTTLVFMTREPTYGTLTNYAVYSRHSLQSRRQCRFNLSTLS